MPSHIRQMGTENNANVRSFTKVFVGGGGTVPVAIAERKERVGAKLGKLLVCHLLILLNGRTEMRHLVAFKPKGLVSAAISC